MVPAVLLALALPLAIGIAQVTSLGNVSLPVAFAFGLLGLRMARSGPASTPEGERAPHQATAGVQPHRRQPAGSSGRAR